MVQLYRVPCMRMPEVLTVSVWRWGGHPKINAQSSTPISCPQSYEFTTSRDGGCIYCVQPYPTILIGGISTSTARMLMLTPSHPWSLYMKCFILDPMWMLQKTSEGQHRVSCSTNLEETQLSAAGLVADNPHFVVLLLGWWWHTLPAQLHDHTKGNALCRRDENKSVLVEDCECLVCWFFMRYEGMPSATQYSTSYGSHTHWSFTFLFH